MRPHSRATRTALGRAAVASIALHIAAAGAVFLLLRDDDTPASEPAVDTRAPAQVRMSFAAVSVEAEPVPPAPPVVDQRPAKQTPTVPSRMPQAAEPDSAGRPVASMPPRTLPPELMALVRKSAAAATPAAFSAGTDPNVRPVAHPGSAPLHGELKPNATVVYVLDCSGSMGAGGKLAAARAALIATLQQQPETVRFQVIVYAGAARALLPSNGNPLLATAANVRSAADALAAVEPRGKSSHAEAVRAALMFRPDAVLLLTDADDLSAASLRGVLKAAERPVAVFIGQVSAGGVQHPRELK